MAEQDAAPADTAELGDPATRGRLEVRTGALQHLVEHAAATVPGTVTQRSGLDRLRGRGYPHADITVKGSTSWVTLHVAAVWPCAVEQIMTTTRDRVQAKATELSGTTVAEVDVVMHLVSADPGNERRVV
ncbi:hypothetical protein [Flexivirga meconopsidis]|uniref:hypothetical protein n=1 Tax=Flexivirga meconopsidis TaxID=2977121 RepID=UPI00223F45C4|nr:hypothetical protein [Flexivirga meconopsidis]